MNRSESVVNTPINKRRRRSLQGPNVPTDDLNATPGRTPFKISNTSLAVNANSTEKQQRMSERRTSSSSFSTPRYMTPKQALRQRLSGSGISSPASPIVTVELDQFNQWLKLANEGKITQFNTWEIDLIDYFDDMSLLMENGKLNFKTAAATLSGSMKVFSSRVGAVAVDSSKLLHNIIGADSEAVHEKDGEEQTDKPKRTKKNGNKKVIADDIRTITRPASEIDRATDPLFHKTCSEFSEGGTTGLLFNTLSIDHSGRYGFDTRELDEIVEEDRPNDQPELNYSDMYKDSNDIPSSAHEQLPIGTQLNSTVKYGFSLTALKELFIGSLEALDSLDVCPTLKGFNITGSTQYSVPSLQELMDDYADYPGRNEFESSVESNINDDPVTDAPEFEAEPTQFEAEADYEPMGIVDERLMDHQEENISQLWGVPEIPYRPDTVQTALKAFDDARVFVTSKFEGGPVDNEHDSDDKADGAGMPYRVGDAMFAQFDKALAKSWAGPSQFKPGRFTLEKLKQSKVKEARAKKSELIIDFSEVSPDVEELFRPGRASINLPRKQLSNSSRFLLPDDCHFSSERILRLFIKPESRISVRRQFGTVFIDHGAGEAKNIASEWPEELQPDVGSHPDDNEVYGGYGSDFFDNNAPLPFTTDEDFLGLDKADNDVFVDANEMDIGEDDGDTTCDYGKRQKYIKLKLTRASRMIYSKKPKTVDVRKLKRNLWDSLQLIDYAEDRDNGKTYEMPPPKPLARLASDLKSKYQEKEYKEISTSMCFLSVLHLANEKGLQLKSLNGFKGLFISLQPTARVMDLAE
ncbi:hypothetical protein CANCADRAFT_44552 [Tortispora caseinolytica NRRL Y-17796]|uniref:Condensin complex subunit 2 n=1 Tax=Tortispora caseinolytica NRRL Y-17796 TaxID=767744 RepID=A0A1E4TGN0_9ASCO|nr:hypothetical protein CANCADRAFT_44552 [Tortispora caseinolytica NRRL Y-17796]